MKKIILMILLSLMSSVAIAGWVEVGGTDDFTSYADPSSIRKSGSRIKMWMLFDLKAAKTTAAGKTYLSNKIQNEFDCTEEQTRILYIFAHSGHMGEGDKVNSIADRVNHEWTPIPPGSIIETLFQFACKKR